MSLEVRGHCPLCEGETIVNKYQCKKCKTSFEGQFKLNKFSKLNDKQLEIVELFLIHRGNIKELEKALKLSYPTVRNLLDEIVLDLGHKVRKDQIDREEILQKVANKEITADEAVELLRS